MRKIIIIFIAIITSMFAGAQNDTISVIGAIKDIKPVQEKLKTNRFEVKVKTFPDASIKIDSSIVFYIQNPKKQLKINDYQNSEAYKDKFYFFILHIDEDEIIFIDAIEPSVIRGKCPKCNKPLLGFRFLSWKGAHLYFYCPTHGIIHEEWETYK